MPTAHALHLSAFGLDQLQLVPIDVAAPGPHQVQVALHYAALNYRDLMTVTGTYNPRQALPLVPGSDAAGVVTAVGDAVTRFRVGDRVCSLFFQSWQSGRIEPTTCQSALGGALPGVFCSQRLFPETGLIAAPEHLSLAEAATLPCAALTAWHALVEVGHLRAGETVLVQGTGGVSLFALQIAKAHGATVILTSSSDDKLERGRALGADYTINYRQTPEWDAEALRLTANLGVDHVVEVGGSGTLPRSMKAVRPGGRVYVIGVLAGREQTVDPRSILTRSIHLDGIFVGSAAMFRSMNQAFTATQLHPVVDRIFPLDEAREALAHLQTGAHFGKIVLMS